MRVKRSKSLIARNVDSTLSGKNVKKWKSQIYKALCMVEGWGGWIKINLELNYEQYE